jgi:HSP20 family molecular chaperone IbpA
MSRPLDPTDWMWAHACQLLDEAERMHRQFFRLASSPRSQALWEPPVDVLEDEHEVIVVVALPGVVAERVDVVREPGFLVVRAERALPLAGTHRAVRQLEIPYGRFERRIAMPDRLRNAEPPELTHGCLVVRLRKIAEGPE